MQKFTMQSFMTIHSFMIDIKAIQIGIIITISFITIGCVSQESFNVKNIAKSDIDLVTDDSLQQVTKCMKQLTVKLYKRNPLFLKKKTIEQRLDDIFICPVKKNIKEVNYKSGVDAILLGFDEDYTEDRVFAIMYGLYSMIITSYNDNCECFIINFLNQQKLYNSARNIEILAWRFGHRLKKNGEPFLLTSETQGVVKNLSFERLYGKMIAIQDMMAIIMADKTNRAINEVVHSVSSVFLPLKF